MTIQGPIGKTVPLIPETAPFSSSQRAWLNGFFAGAFSNTSTPGIMAAGVAPAGIAAAIAAGDGDEAVEPRALGG